MEKVPEVEPDAVVVDGLSASTTGDGGVGRAVFYRGMSQERPAGMYFYLERVESPSSSSSALAHNAA